MEPCPAAEHSEPSSPESVAVRYGYTNDLDNCNLCGTDQLPGFPVPHG